MAEYEAEYIKLSQIVSILSTKISILSTKKMARPEFQKGFETKNSAQGDIFYSVTLTCLNHRDRLCTILEIL